MTTQKQLVEFCEKKMGTPYVFGMKGEILTADKLKRLKAECPQIHTDDYQRQAGQFIGRACTDCSGLISWCTGIVRGSSDYYQTAVKKKPVSAMGSCTDKSIIGWAVWKPGHIGVYVGDGYCIEAKGIKYGTVKTKVSDNPKWQYLLKLKDIQYAEVTDLQKEPVKPAANCWQQDPVTKKWYWLNGAGAAIHDDWYCDSGRWYYFDSDCTMAVGLRLVKGKFYWFEDAGSLSKEGLSAVFEWFLRKVWTGRKGK